MEENIPNINSNCLCVYLFIQVFVCFCFFYTNFSHFSMMNFFYNEKNAILKKKNYDVPNNVHQVHTSIKVNI